MIRPKCGQGREGVKNPGFFADVLYVIWSLSTREGVPRGETPPFALWLAAPFLIVEGMLTNGKRKELPYSPLARCGGQPGLRWMAVANTQIRITLASRPSQAK